MLRRVSPILSRPTALKFQKEFRRLKSPIDRNSHARFIAISYFLALSPNLENQHLQLLLSDGSEKNRSNLRPMMPDNFIWILINLSF